MLQRRLWSEELSFFVTESQPPPPNLRAELRRMSKLGRSREVQVLSLASEQPLTPNPQP